MQNTFALLRGWSALIVMLCFVTSCDLPVQPKFEFESEIGELVTFEDQTVLEWMSSPASVVTNNNANFDIMVEAIALTGMEEEYNDPSDRRTFFMLNNESFTANNRIFRALGVTALDSLDTDGIDRLRNILQYHIIDEYVDQGPEALPVLLTNYTFQSLIPGAEGEIIVHRDERFRMFINKRPLVNQLAIGLPSNARRTDVRNHNYVFSNGVGHQLRNYARNRPF
jgi:hypothetical protein